MLEEGPKQVFVFSSETPFWRLKYWIWQERHVTNGWGVEKKAYLEDDIIERIST